MDATNRALSIPFLRAKHAFVPEKIDVAASSNMPTDEDLLESICNNHEGAALSLFRRYVKLAFSIGYRVLKDEGEAEDLTQEMFLRLCAEAGTFDRAKGSARTWIIQMLYRRAFDRRAYLNRRHFYSGTDVTKQTNTVNGEKSPEGAMIERLTAHQLKSAFSELSNRQRETLEAFFFEGLTLAEIAARSDQDVTNVRHHYYRGLERLRQLVRQMMRDRKIGQ
ncbi:MAG TPA: sigma-70 family RNA polymerase sigma factor [Chroococcales cyanobacterium]